MRIRFFCLLLLVFCTGKAASSDSETKKYLDLDDKEDSVILWESLFTKINTILSDTTRLSANLVELNKRQDAQELKLTNFMENTQNQLANLKKEQDSQQLKLSNFMENTQKNLTDLKKGSDELEPKISSFMEITQSQLTDLEKEQDSQQLKLSNFMENTQKNLTDLKKGSDELEPKISSFMEIIQNQLADLQKGHDALERNLTHFVEENLTNSTKWTTILRRQDGSVDFYRNWTEYQRGFGNPNGEFFIGLDKLHAMTTLGAPQELMVILKDFGNETRIAKYDLFKIGDEREKYALKELGKYSGDAGDALDHHKGMKFSTYDNDNDKYWNLNCAKHCSGAWWYMSCYDSHLFGTYRTENIGYKYGVDWKQWKGSYYSYKFAEMKIRSICF